MKQANRSGLFFVSTVQLGSGVYKLELGRQFRNGRTPSFLIPTDRIYCGLGRNKLEFYTHLLVMINVVENLMAKSIGGLSRML
jgi:hypothetical protein